MRTRWIVYTWPGYAQMVDRAEVSGLLVAILFTFCLNFLMTATFVWTELIATAWLRGLWACLAIAWIVSIATSVRRAMRYQSVLHSLASRDLFLAANKEYLKGKYEGARDKLQKLIEQNPRDAEAKLMLSTIALRQGRWEDCDRALRQLQRLGSAAVWSAEIRQQWKRLEQMRVEEATAKRIRDTERTAESTRAAESALEPNSEIITGTEESPETALRRCDGDEAEKQQTGEASCESR